MNVSSDEAMWYTTRTLRLHCVSVAPRPCIPSERRHLDANRTGSIQSELHPVQLAATRLTTPHNEDLASVAWRGVPCKAIKTHAQVTRG